MSKAFQRRRSTPPNPMVRRRQPPPPNPGWAFHDAPSTSSTLRTVQSEGQFSCEIERDGKVHRRGVTSTGERTVAGQSCVYEMKFQQQCPPGPFTLSFGLSGPVDPRLFSPNFRSDGILEALVMKYK